MDQTETVKFMKSAYNQQLGGYGFAAFCYALGAVIMFLAALYISPIFCGSPFERRMVFSGPVELEDGYATNQKDSYA